MPQLYLFNSCKTVLCVACSFSWIRLIHAGEPFSNSIDNRQTHVLLPSNVVNHFDSFDRVLISHAVRHTNSIYHTHFHINEPKDFIWLKQLICPLNHVFGFISNFVTIRCDSIEASYLMLWRMVLKWFVFLSIGPGVHSMIKVKLQLYYIHIRFN